MIYYFLKQPTFRMRFQVTLSRENVNDNLIGAHPLPIRVAAWLVDDIAVLIHDNYEYLESRSLGNHSTGEYYKWLLVSGKVELELRLLTDEEATYSTKSNLLLTGFNVAINTMDSIKRNFIKRGIRDCYHVDLSMFTLQVPKRTDISKCHEPLKASKADKWIIMQQSEKDAPNFFFTTDLKDYKELSKYLARKKTQLV